MKSNNDLPPHYKAAHESLTLLGEAKAANDKDAYSTAYDSYMRALRGIDTAEFDAELVDSYGNVYKKSEEFTNIPDYERAWNHDLPEDSSF